MNARPDAATYFSGRSEHYDSRYDARNADGHALRARMSLVLRCLGDGPGELLDAGMGPGRLCVELAAREWTVSGIDASDEMVEAARERLPESAERLRLAEIEALPFDGESFDAAVATGVLEYANASQALGELVRVLRPGGLLVVSYPNPRALYGIWKTQVVYRTVRALKQLGRRPHARMPRGGPAIAPARLVGMLRALGLQIERVEHASYLVLPTPLDMLFPGLAARVGARLEGGGGPPVARVLGTQVVYAARKI